MLQRNTTTAFNRYPGIFRTIKARMFQKYGPALKGGALRVLSFGCSTGEELSTLRAYFPDATIFGCDANSAALQIAKDSARKSAAILFPSEARHIQSFAPFDIIFAMSVLCKWPNTHKTENIFPIFPFSQFFCKRGDA
jgi:chemotaxis methyl-accepting protein methylase